MKLKTESIKGTIFCDPDAMDALHDAAAAHAFQQAIKEWWDNPVEDLESESAVTLIEEWADEIMREWGYDDAGQGAEG